MRACTRRELHVIALASVGRALLGCNRGAPVDGTATPVMNEVTLTFESFPKLITAGGSAVVDVTGSFPIVVVRTSDTEAVALSATCTHAGCLVGFSGDNEVHCPCHNANFKLDGSVINGPTSIPLPVYAATVAPGGIIIDLS
jgi:cytochrome b6-f complex iron-sulfur subunit